MRIEIKIDENCREPHIIVVTDRMTEELKRLVSAMSSSAPDMIAGFKNDTAELLDPKDIISVYASSGKTVAETETGEYTLKMRLYELEQRLREHSFVRISNSEIINLKKARAFDLSLVGTVCVRLSNGRLAYASRRYVSAIKKVLGI